ncbi:MAG TPA: ATP-binding cassette domain-containing protein [Bacteroidia bacterium]|nr:ATP-binding cassette domain-containing protein [Bacteroidia bacterium]
MEDYVFYISDLSCSYTRTVQNRVLYIREYGVPRGKLTFLLGPSGSGKSTLLETLGLMNNTFAEGKVQFNPGPNQHSFSLDTVWKPQHEHELNTIRKQHYSFIFQENNLMEDFSAFENICLSQMVKDDRSFAEVVKPAELILKRVGLNAKEVNQYTLATNLSGGQRQRLSFVRALNVNYSVLFCDEPTGNLDEVNAHELMDIVKGSCSVTRSAIVVSHDINLALKYADQIAVITKSEGEGCGVIHPGNVFNREQWEHNDTEHLQSFREKIRKLYFTPEASVKPEEPKDRNELSHIGFNRLFVRNELRSLYGKSYVNYFILLFLTIFSLLVLGFANGTLNYIDQKLNDAFVNWVTLKIPWAQSGDRFQEIKEKLNEPANRTRYQYSSATSYPEYSLTIFDKTSFDKVRVFSEKGRTIETGDPPDPMLKDILSKENLVSGSTFTGISDFGLIVSSQLLSNYKYNLKDRFLYIGYKNFDGNQDIYERIPVPIRAVVRSIPGKNLFVSTNYFKKAYDQATDNTFDPQVHRNKICLYLQFAEQEIPEFQKDFRTAVAGMKDFESWNPEMDIVSDHLVDTGQSRIAEIRFSSEPEDTSLSARFIHSLFSTAAFQPWAQKVTPFYDLSQFAENLPELSDDILCINFNGDLDSIRAFKQFLYSLNKAEEKEVIELDDSAIREKENYNFMSKVTLIISFGLLFFAVFCISLFIMNVLRLHLLKVKMNLGTLKAFGLNNSETNKLYSGIMMLFVAFVMVPGFLIAFVAGKMIDQLIGSYLAMDSNYQYFQITDGLIIGIIFVIFVVSLLVTGWVARKILMKSPGDLIYNR